KSRCSRLRAFGGSAAKARAARRLQPSGRRRRSPERLALHGSLRARYLLFRIAIRPEHAVLLHLWRGGRRAEIGVHVLPYNVAVARHLEEAAEVPFVDERVAVRQPLRARDARAEEIEHARLLVLPHDLA